MHHGDILNTDTAAKEDSQWGGIPALGRKTSHVTKYPSMAMMSWHDMDSARLHSMLRVLPEQHGHCWDCTILRGASHDLIFNRVVLIFLRKTS